ncbi:extracellular solute-binding protein [Conyzicola sp.]|uniref:extracellular solute-binding protein n=1 Tax=Conyzicola sp. TaxID=1969404 RepID=UPI0039898F14
MIRSTRPLIATVAFGAVLALSSCAATEPAESEPGAETTITFSSYSYGTQGAAGEGMQTLLDAFAAEHPEITVLPEAVPVADALTKTKAAVAAGSPPDVQQLGYSKMAEAFATLPVQSIQDIAGDEWDAHVEGIAAGLVSTGADDNTVKALPFTVSIPTVFYNADLFREAGLDPETPPTTIDEVAEAAEAITAAGHNGVYFGLLDQGKSDYLTQSVMDSAGGKTVDDDGTVVLDSAKAVAGIQKIQDLTTEGLQPAVGIDDAVAAFSTGDLGMFVSTTALMSNLQAGASDKFELRTAGFPSFDSKPARPTHSGAGLIVLADDEAKQKAAWEFVKFMTSEQGYTMITEEMGYLPLRANLATDEKFLAGYFAENTLLLPPLEQLENVTPYRSFAGAKSNQATVMLQDDAISPIILRGADTQKTLSEVADRIRELVESE